jgi:hypothetical protein
MEDDGISNCDSVLMKRCKLPAIQAFFKNQTEREMAQHQADKELIF